MLKDSVALYAIFVDVGIYHPWTEFDIKSAQDSIRKACDWIENEASIKSIQLKIGTSFHRQSNRSTIYEKSAKTALSINGLRGNQQKSYKKLTPWADAIASYAGRGLKYKASNGIHQKFKINSIQNLNLALRDQMKMENVAIMFFVNGYYENDPSISFYTNTAGQNVEYSIITTKNPAVIAHEFFHLFGAVDLYQNMNYPNFNFEELDKKFPNEIMNIQHKEIDKLNVSPITSYFLGWQDTLDHANTRLLFHKLNVLEY